MTTADKIYLSLHANDEMNELEKVFGDIEKEINEKDVDEEEKEHDEE